MHQPPKAPSSPHAFSFCGHCGGYRHTGACPQPEPLPPLPRLALPALPSVAANPLEPSVGQIVFGVALVGWSAWLLLAALPPHRPLSGLAAALDGGGAWRFRTSGIYYSLCAFAALLGLAGLEQILRGGLRRTFVLTDCKRCDARVWALRRAGQLRCRNGDHVARRDRTHLLLGVLLTLLGVLAALALLAFLYDAAS